MPKHINRNRRGNDSVGIQYKVLYRFVNFQQLVSDLTRLHTFTYYPFSGASWACEHLFLGTQAKIVRFV